MTNTQVLLLVLLFAAAWGLQMGAGGWQARRFMREAKRVRRAGRSAIGLGGRRSRGKAYVAIAVDRHDRVVAATSLHGRTVLASAKPVPDVLDARLVDLLDPETGPLGDTALGAAAANAAEHLLGLVLDDASDADADAGHDDGGPAEPAATPRPMRSGHLPG